MDVTSAPLTTVPPLKIAVIAGEVSGDLLGADLIAALKRRHAGPLQLTGVGGDALEAEGLVSLFDFSELSLMGFTQVIGKLPNLIRRIGETAAAIIAARPDVLIIIDSPDFTHRVAKRVRKALPGLAIVNYVCPSVWAWKEYRAQAMLGYVDHVLALLPFEPAVMTRLGGPATTFVGHRLTSDADIIATRAKRALRPAPDADAEKSILLLPGSRAGEIRHLLPVFGQAAQELAQRHGNVRFVLPTVPRQEALVRTITDTWQIKPEIVVGRMEKWEAFARADAAMAASGTVILELALAQVPVVSAYKADWLITMMAKRIKTWSAALPNLIADYAVVPEYINESLRPASLVRWIERLSADTLQRRAMLEGFDLVWDRLRTPVSSGEIAAGIVLDVIAGKRRAQP